MQFAYCSFLFLLLSRLVWAQESILAKVRTQMPACALPCLSNAIEDSPCPPTDGLCICSNAKLLADAEACVLSVCTLKEGLRTQNVTQTTCRGPVRNQVKQLRVTNIVLGVISAVCVILRIVYMAAFSIAELGWDDYLIVLALFVGIPQTIITDRGTTANGLGRDVWTVPFDEITEFARFFYIMEVLYFFILMTLKLALLFFFLRIFPARNTRKIIWSTIIFTLLWGMACVIAAIFQCSPISYNWDRWDGEHEGTCLSINGLAWSNAGISIFLDFWMLALPLYEVYHLKLSWRKKLSVALMFSVGTFVTVMSVLRLQSLIHFGKSLNVTWDQADASNWSTIEINVGILCACLPSLRKIFIHVFPGQASIAATNTSQYNAKYGSGYPGNQESGKRGNRSNIVGSAGISRIGRDRDGISYTKTFEVRHGDNDEEQLVKMDNLSAKGTKTRSSNSSETSANGIILPIHGPTSR
ncbi:unnamed protein product [Periconia digitata]|uniref:CFEM domain-containing protein n=1 Tax=Periconia digitata TaxID=1303443 RepID=A0A9W4UAK8_9PLEO|nr:unnamed protein product [Periconia digitata]